MAFFESPRFPDCIAAGSNGGPNWLTEVVVVNSGYEQSNARWAHARHSYDASFGVRSMSDMEQLISYFNSARGRFHRFRFKDHADFQSVGVGDRPGFADQPVRDLGGNDYQLLKAYDQFAGDVYYRDIVKPVDGSVRVSVGGVEVTTGFSVDYTTGIVSFTSTPGSVVAWGGQFDVPVRFDTDRLSVVLENFLNGAAEVPLVEVRL